MTRRRLSGRWVWLGGRWVRDVVIVVDEEGSVADVEIGRTEPGAYPALLPAFHNAHSHAFQWAMRGRSHARPPGHADDDFWSWREHMYALAEASDPADLERVATECYAAMRDVGYASVGEFHYLHHQPGGAPYDPAWAMAEALARAAKSTGIRLVLLPAAYHRGGAATSLAPTQARFSFPDPATFVRYVRETRRALGSDDVTVGYAAHSIRAVPADWLPVIAEAAAEDDAPLHVHASEQRRELAECRAEHGLTPIALLADRGFLGPRTTVVHATHATESEIDLLAGSGAIVCACPTTERDLGDGLLPARPLLERGVPVCFGSDSHTLVDAREEMRLAEYHERLRLEQRNVLTLSDRGLQRPAATLIRWATECGARSLAVDSGEIRPGAQADIVALRWSDQPTTSEQAAEAFDRWLFSTREAAIDGVWVRGRSPSLSAERPGS